MSLDQSALNIMPKIRYNFPILDKYKYYVQNGLDDARATRLAIIDALDYNYQKFYNPNFTVDSLPNRNIEGTKEVGINELDYIIKNYKTATDGFQQYKNKETQDYENFKNDKKEKEQSKQKEEIKPVIKIEEPKQQQQTQQSKQQQIQQPKQQQQVSEDNSQVTKLNFMPNVFKDYRDNYVEKDDVTTSSKQEQITQQDTVKQGTVKQDTTKQNVTKQDTVKQDIIEQDTVKQKKTTVQNKKIPKNNVSINKGDQYYYLVYRNSDPKYVRKFEEIKAYLRTQSEDESDVVPLAKYLTLKAFHDNKYNYKSLDNIESAKHFVSSIDWNDLLGIVNPSFGEKEQQRNDVPTTPIKYYMEEDGSLEAKFDLKNAKQKVETYEKHVPLYKERLETIKQIVPAKEFEKVLNKNKSFAYDYAKGIAMSSAAAGNKIGFISPYDKDKEEKYPELKTLRYFEDLIAQGKYSVNLKEYEKKVADEWYERNINNKIPSYNKLNTIEKKALHFTKGFLSYFYTDDLSEAFDMPNREYVDLLEHITYKKANNNQINKEKIDTVKKYKEEVDGLLNQGFEAAGAAVPFMIEMMASGSVGVIGKVKEAAKLTKGLTLIKRILPIAKALGIGLTEAGVKSYAIMGGKAALQTITSPYMHSDESTFDKTKYAIFTGIIEPAVEGISEEIFGEWGFKKNLAAPLIQRIFKGITNWTIFNVQENLEEDFSDTVRDILISKPNEYQSFIGQLFNETPDFRNKQIIAISTALTIGALGGVNAYHNFIRKNEILRGHEDVMMTIFNKKIDEVKSKILDNLIGISNIKEAAKLQDKFNQVVNAAFNLGKDKAATIEESFKLGIEELANQNQDGLLDSIIDEVKKNIPQISKSIEDEVNQIIPVLQKLMPSYDSNLIKAVLLNKEDSIRRNYLLFDTTVAEIKGNLFKYFINETNSKLTQSRTVVEKLQEDIIQLQEKIKTEKDTKIAQGYTQEINQKIQSIIAENSKINKLQKKKAALLINTDVTSSKGKVDYLNLMLFENPVEYNIDEHLEKNINIINTYLLKELGYSQEEINRINNKVKSLDELSEDEEILNRVMLQEAGYKKNEIDEIIANKKYKKYSTINNATINLALKLDNPKIIQRLLSIHYAITDKDINDEDEQIFAHTVMNNLKERIIAQKMNDYTGLDSKKARSLYINKLKNELPEIFYSLNMFNEKDIVDLVEGYFQATDKAGYLKDFIENKVAANEENIKQYLVNDPNIEAKIEKLEKQRNRIINNLTAQITNTFNRIEIEREAYNRAVADKIFDYNKPILEQIKEVVGEKVYDEIIKDLPQDIIDEINNFDIKQYNVTKQIPEKLKPYWYLFQVVSPMFVNEATTEQELTDAINNGYFVRIYDSKLIYNKKTGINYVGISKYLMNVFIQRDIIANFKQPEIIKILQNFDQIDVKQTAANINKELMDFYHYNDYNIFKQLFGKRYKFNTNNKVSLLFLLTPYEKVLEDKANNKEGTRETKLYDELNELKLLGVDSGLVEYLRTSFMLKAPIVTTELNVFQIPKEVKPFFDYLISEIKKETGSIDLSGINKTINSLKKNVNSLNIKKFITTIALISRQYNKDTAKKIVETIINSPDFMINNGYNINFIIGELTRIVNNINNNDTKDIARNSINEFIKILRKYNDENSYNIDPIDYSDYNDLIDKFANNKEPKKFDELTYQYLEKVFKEANVSLEHLDKAFELYGNLEAPLKFDDIMQYIISVLDIEGIFNGEIGDIVQNRLHKLILMLSYFEFEKNINGIPTTVPFMHSSMLNNLLDISEKIYLSYLPDSLSNKTFDKFIKSIIQRNNLMLGNIDLGKHFPVKYNKKGNLINFQKYVKLFEELHNLNPRHTYLLKIAEELTKIGTQYNQLNLQDVTDEITNLHNSFVNNKITKDKYVKEMSDLLTEYIKLLNYKYNKNYDVQIELDVNDENIFAKFLYSLYGKSDKAIPENYIFEVFDLINDLDDLGYNVYITENLEDLEVVLAAFDYYNKFPEKRIVRNIKTLQQKYSEGKIDTNTYVKSLSIILEKLLDKLSKKYSSNSKLKFNLDKNSPKIFVDFIGDILKNTDVYDYHFFEELFDELSVVMNLSEYLDELNNMMTSDNVEDEFAISSLAEIMTEYLNDKQEVNQEKKLLLEDIKYKIPSENSLIIFFQDSLEFPNEFNNYTPETLIESYNITDPAVKKNVEEIFNKISNYLKKYNISNVEEHVDNIHKQLYGYIESAQSLPYIVYSDNNNHFKDKKKLLTDLVTKDNKTYIYINTDYTKNLLERRTLIRYAETLFYTEHMLDLFNKRDKDEILQKVDNVRRYLMKVYNAIKDLDTEDENFSEKLWKGLYDNRLITKQVHANRNNIAKDNLKYIYRVIKHLAETKITNESYLKVLLGYYFQGSNIDVDFASEFKEVNINDIKIFFGVLSYKQYKATHRLYDYIIETISKIINAINITYNKENLGEAIFKLYGDLLSVGMEYTRRYKEFQENIEKKRKELEEFGYKVDGNIATIEITISLQNKSYKFSQTKEITFDYSYYGDTAILDKNKDFPVKYIYYNNELFEILDEISDIIKSDGEYKFILYEKNTKKPIEIPVNNIEGVKNISGKETFYLKDEEQKLDKESILNYIHTTIPKSKNLITFFEDCFVFPSLLQSYNGDVEKFCELFNIYNDELKKAVTDIINKVSKYINDNNLVDEPYVIDELYKDIEGHLYKDREKEVPYIVYSDKNYAFSGEIFDEDTYGVYVNSTKTIYINLSKAPYLSIRKNIINHERNHFYTNQMLEFLDDDSYKDIMKDVDSLRSYVTKNFKRHLAKLDIESAFFVEEFWDVLYKEAKIIDKTAYDNRNKFSDETVKYMFSVLKNLSSYEERIEFLNEIFAYYFQGGFTPPSSEEKEISLTDFKLLFSLLIYKNNKNNIAIKAIDKIKEIVKKIINGLNIAYNSDNVGEEILSLYERMIKNTKSIRDPKRVQTGYKEFKEKFESLGYTVNGNTATLKYTSKKYAHTYDIEYLLVDPYLQPMKAVKYKAPVKVMLYNNKYAFVNQHGIEDGELYFIIHLLIDGQYQKVKVYEKDTELEGDSEYTGLQWLIINKIHILKEEDEAETTEEIKEEQPPKNEEDEEDYDDWEVVSSLEDALKKRKKPEKTSSENIVDNIFDDSNNINPGDYDDTFDGDDIYMSQVNIEDNQIENKQLFYDIAGKYNIANNDLHSLLAIMFNNNVHANNNFANPTAYASELIDVLAFFIYQNKYFGINKENSDNLENIRIIKNILRGNIDEKYNAAAVQNIKQFLQDLYTLYYNLLNTSNYFSKASKINNVNYDYLTISTDSVFLNANLSKDNFINTLIFDLTSNDSFGLSGQHVYNLYNTGLYNNYDLDIDVNNHNLESLRKYIERKYNNAVFITYDNSTATYLIPPKDTKINIIESYNNVPTKYEIIKNKEVVGTYTVNNLLGTINEKSTGVQAVFVDFHIKDGKSKHREYNVGDKTINLSTYSFNKLSKFKNNYTKIGKLKYNNNLFYSEIPIPEAPKPDVGTNWINQAENTENVDFTENLLEEFELGGDYGFEHNVNINYNGLTDLLQRIAKINGVPVEKYKEYIKTMTIEEFMNFFLEREGDDYNTIAEKNYRLELVISRINEKTTYGEYTREEIIRNVLVELYRKITSLRYVNTIVITIPEDEKLEKIYSHLEEDTEFAKELIKEGGPNVKLEGKYINPYFPDMEIFSYMEEMSKLTGIEIEVEIIAGINGESIGRIGLTDISDDVLENRLEVISKILDKNNRIFLLPFSDKNTLPCIRFKNAQDKKKFEEKLLEFHNQMEDLYRFSKFTIPQIEEYKKANELQGDVNEDIVQYNSKNRQYFIETYGEEKGLEYIKYLYNIKMFNNAEKVSRKEILNAYTLRLLIEEIKLGNKEWLKTGVLNYTAIKNTEAAKLYKRQKPIIAKYNGKVNSVTLQAMEEAGIVLDSNPDNIAYYIPEENELYINAAIVGAEGMDIVENDEIYNYFYDKYGHFRYDGCTFILPEVKQILSINDGSMNPGAKKNYITWENTMWKHSMQVVTEEADEYNIYQYMRKNNIGILAFNTNEKIATKVPAVDSYGYNYIGAAIYSYDINNNVVGNLAKYQTISAYELFEGGAKDKRIKLPISSIMRIGETHTNKTKVKNIQQLVNSSGVCSENPLIPDELVEIFRNLSYEHGKKFVDELFGDENGVEKQKIKLTQYVKDVLNDEKKYNTSVHEVFRTLYGYLNEADDETIFQTILYSRYVPVVYSIFRDFYGDELLSRVKLEQKGTSCTLTPDLGNLSPARKNPNMPQAYDDDGYLKPDYCHISRDVAERMNLKVGSRIIVNITPTDSAMGIKSVIVANILDTDKIDTSTVILSPEYIMLVGKDYDIDKVAMFVYDKEFMTWETWKKMVAHLKDLWISYAAAMEGFTQQDNIADAFSEKNQVKALSRLLPTRPNNQKINPFTMRGFLLAGEYTKKMAAIIAMRQFHLYFSMNGLIVNQIRDGKSNPISVARNPNWLDIHLAHLLLTNWEVDYPNTMAKENFIYNEYILFNMMFGNKLWDGMDKQEKMKLLSEGKPYVPPKYSYLYKVYRRLLSALSPLFNIPRFKNQPGFSRTQNTLLSIYNHEQKLVRLALSNNEKLVIDFEYHNRYYIEQFINAVTTVSRTEYLIRFDKTAESYANNYHLVNLKFFLDNISKFSDKYFEYRLYALIGTLLNTIDDLAKNDNKILALDYMEGKISYIPTALSVLEWGKKIVTDNKVEYEPKNTPQIVAIGRAIKASIQQLLFLPYNWKYAGVKPIKIGNTVNLNTNRKYYIVNTRQLENTIKDLDEYLESIEYKSEEDLTPEIMETMIEKVRGHIAFTNKDVDDIENSFEVIIPNIKFTNHENEDSNIVEARAKINKEAIMNLLAEEIHKELTTRDISEKYGIDLLWYEKHFATILKEYLSNREYAEQDLEEKIKYVFAKVYGIKYDKTKETQEKLEKQIRSALKDIFNVESIEELKQKYLELNEKTQDPQIEAVKEQLKDYATAKPRWDRIFLASFEMLLTNRIQNLVRYDKPINLNNEVLPYLLSSFYYWYCQITDIARTLEGKGLQNVFRYESTLYNIIIGGVLGRLNYGTYRYDIYLQKWTRRGKGILLGQQERNVTKISEMEKMIENTIGNSNLNTIAYKYLSKQFVKHIINEPFKIFNTVSFGLSTKLINEVNNLLAENEKLEIDGNYTITFSSTPEESSTNNTIIFKKNDKVEAVVRKANENKIIEAIFNTNEVWNVDPMIFWNAFRFDNQTNIRDNVRIELVKNAVDEYMQEHNLSFTPIEGKTFCNLKEVMAFATLTHNTGLYNTAEQVERIPASTAVTLVGRNYKEGREYIEQLSRHYSQPNNMFYSAVPIPPEFMEDVAQGVATNDYTKAMDKIKVEYQKVEQLLNNQPPANSTHYLQINYNNLIDFYEDLLNNSNNKQNLLIDLYRHIKNLQKIYDKRNYKTSFWYYLRSLVPLPPVFARNYDKPIFGSYLSLKGVFEAITFTRTSYNKYQNVREEQTKESPYFIEAMKVVVSDMVSPINERSLGMRGFGPLRLAVTKEQQLQKDIITLEADIAKYLSSRTLRDNMTDKEMSDYFLEVIRFEEYISKNKLFNIKINYDNDTIDLMIDGIEFRDITPENILLGREISSSDIQRLGLQTYKKYSIIDLMLHKLANYNFGIENINDIKNVIKTAVLNRILYSGFLPKEVNKVVNFIKTMLSQPEVRNDLIMYTKIKKLYKRIVVIYNLLNSQISTTDGKKDFIPFVVERNMFEKMYLERKIHLNNINPKTLNGKIKIRDIKKEIKQILKEEPYYIPIFSDKINQYNYMYPVSIRTLERDSIFTKALTSQIHNIILNIYKVQYNYSNKLYKIEEEINKKTSYLYHKGVDYLDDLNVAKLSPKLIGKNVVFYYDYYLSNFSDSIMDFEDYREMLEEENKSISPSIIAGELLNYNDKYVEIKLPSGEIMKYNIHGVYAYRKNYNNYTTLSPYEGLFGHVFVMPDKGILDYLDKPFQYASLFLSHAIMGGVYGIRVWFTNHIGSLIQIANELGYIKTIKLALKGSSKLQQLSKSNDPKDKEIMDRLIVATSVVGAILDFSDYAETEKSSMQALGQTRKEYNKAVNMLKDLSADNPIAEQYFQEIINISNMKIDVANQIKVYEDELKILLENKNKDRAMIMRIDELKNLITDLQNQIKDSNRMLKALVMKDVNSNVITAQQKALIQKILDDKVLSTVINIYGKGAKSLKWRRRRNMYNEITFILNKLAEKHSRKTAAQASYELSYDIYDDITMQGLFMSAFVSQNQGMYIHYMKPNYERDLKGFGKFIYTLYSFVGNQLNRQSAIFTQAQQDLLMGYYKKYVMEYDSSIDDENKLIVHVNKEAKKRGISALHVFINQIKYNFTLYGISGILGGIELFMNPLFEPFIEMVGNMLKAFAGDDRDEAALIFDFSKFLGIFAGVGFTLPISLALHLTLNLEGNIKTTYARNTRLLMDIIEDMTSGPEINKFGKPKKPNKFLKRNKLQNTIIGLLVPLRQGEYMPNNYYSLFLQALTSPVPYNNVILSQMDWTDVEPMNRKENKRK